MSRYRGDGDHSRIGPPELRRLVRHATEVELRFNIRHAEAVVRFNSMSAACPAI